MFVCSLLITGISVFRPSIVASCPGFADRAPSDSPAALANDLLDALGYAACARNAFREVKLSDEPIANAFEG